jgi:hypothetical protein
MDAAPLRLPSRADSRLLIHCRWVANIAHLLPGDQTPDVASSKNAELYCGAPASHLLGLLARNLLTLGHRRLVRSRLLDSDAVEREVDLFISQKDARMSRIFTIGAAQFGPIQRSGDRARRLAHARSARLTCSRRFLPCHIRRL